MNVATDAILLARQADLVHNLLGAPLIFSFGRIQSRDEMPPFDILLSPPLQQDRKTVLSWLDSPIKLWGKVIYPAIHEPFPGIRVKFPVSINRMRIDSSGNGR